MQYTGSHVTLYTVFLRGYWRLDTLVIICALGVTDDGIVHNGCHHTQSVPSSSIWQITVNKAEYVLTNKPDGTFLVWERSGTVSDPSSSSISTHVFSVV